mmetsp:Transcript_4417/g.6248  ORF Transcript_4417/g.6248 Transcript_4417/m.6248 type:complete len:243 (-) Transcript_4417:59-787(-)
MGCINSRADANNSLGGDGTNRDEFGGMIAAGKRITKGPIWKYGSPVTKQQLNDMRVEFFATRIEGNTYIWQVIKASCEALIEGDEELCNSLMVASALICPSGMMTLCYDDSGFEYKVPRYCFSYPDDMRTTMDEAREINAETKQEYDPGEPIKIKIQIAPEEEKYEIKTTLNILVLDLKKRICEHILNLQGNGQAKKVVGITPTNQRMIYCGRELTDMKTLADLGVSPEFVIQVYVRKVNAK